MAGPKSSKRQPRYITPPNKLKQKVGVGGIDEMLLEKSQQYIENNDIDFAPIAKKLLTRLEKTIENAKAGDIADTKALDGMINPMMQLKGNGGMFQYRLISDIADIGLQFLESVGTINKDVLEVIAAHAQTIKIILKNKLTGDGGKEGYELVKELHKASKRYFVKHPPLQDPKNKKK